MSENYSDLPGWNFEMEEISANVYRVTAKSDNGKLVTRTGIDLDEILAKCRSEAIKLSRQGS